MAQGNPCVGGLVAGMCDQATLYYVFARHMRLQDLHSNALQVNAAPFNAAIRALSAESGARLRVGGEYQFVEDDLCAAQEPD